LTVREAGPREPRGPSMTVQIDALQGLIFVAGCLAAYFIHKRMKKIHPGPVKTGEPAVAIGAGLAVMMALALLFGTEGKPVEKADVAPAPAPSQQIPSPSPSGAAGK
jgi:hypothetical protein